MASLPMTTVSALYCTRGRELNPRTVQDFTACHRNGVHTVIVFLAIGTRREAVYRLVPDEQPLIEEAIKELVG